MSSTNSMRSQSGRRFTSAISLRCSPNESKLSKSSTNWDSAGKRWPERSTSPSRSEHHLKEDESSKAHALTKLRGKWEVGKREIPRMPCNELHNFKNIKEPGFGRGGLTSGVSKQTNKSDSWRNLRPFHYQNHLSRPNKREEKWKDREVDSSPDEWINRWPIPPTTVRFSNASSLLHPRTECGFKVIRGGMERLYQESKIFLENTRPTKYPTTSSSPKKNTFQTAEWIEVRKFHWRRRHFRESRILRKENKWLSHGA